MSQADGYVRIVTQNDTTEAQRSTEQLRDTIQAALDTSPVDEMSHSMDNFQDSINDAGNAAIKTGDIIKANLISDMINQGIQQLGNSLKEAAVRTVEAADGLDSAVKKIDAAANAGAEDMDKLKMAVKQIYSDNFGESFEDIADSIAKIKQNLGNLDSNNLVEITESANALKDVFGYDVSESSRAARAMMENFSVSVAEAYDYIARGAQNGLDYSGELLDNISEYSVQFAKLGLSAGDMFTIFSNGAENGAWNLDKIGDSVKELAIRVIDGSDTTRQGFEALGFNADEMAKKFGEGGESARTAFQKVISAIKAMDDPVAQNTAGINLMGTMWEDMGAEAVLSLGNISESAFDCANAMEGIKDVNYSSLSNSLDRIKRQIDLLIEPIGEQLIPVLKEAADSASDAIQSSDLNDIAESVGEFISGSLSLILKNINLIASAITGVTAAVIAFKTAGILTKVISSWQTAALQVTLLGNAQGAAAVKAAALNGKLSLQEMIYAVLSGKLDIATIKQYALNTAMSLNPAGIVAAAVGLLAAAITGYALQTASAADETKNFSEALSDMKKEYDEQIASGEAELLILEKKVNRYEALRNQMNLTADESSELNGLANDLQATFGDSVAVVDSLTGSYNSLTKAYNDYAAALRANVMSEAKKRLADDAADSLIEMQKEYDSICKQIEDEDFSTLLPDYMKYMYLTESEKRIYKGILESQKKELEDAIAEANAVIDDYINYNSSFINANTNSIDLETETAPSSSSAYGDFINNDKLLEKFKTEREWLKCEYEMGEMDAADYYNSLRRIRDQYLSYNIDSDEYYNASLEIKKYYDQLAEEEKKAYDEQLAAQKKADEESRKAAEQAAADAVASRKTAYSEEKSQLEFQFKTNRITEKKYYSELAKLRDKYLEKNSSEWRSAYLETYEYNQKIIQTNKDALDQLLNGTSDTTLSALEKIVSARDSLTSKLTDFNKTFEKVTETIPETTAVKGDFTITTAEHTVEAYKMGADNIEDNIKILEDYGDMLDALKNRGADESILSSILDMDIEEGMKYGSELLKMSDREWKNYFTSLDRLHKTASDISSKYYQNQVDNLKESFIEKMQKAMDGLGSDMYKVGADVAAEFVKGWNEAMGTKNLTVGEIMRSVSGGTMSTAPDAAKAMSAEAAASAASKAASQIVKIPVYIGTQKLADIIADVTNGKIIQTGKNILLT